MTSAGRTVSGQCAIVQYDNAVRETCGSRRVCARQAAPFCVPVSALISAIRSKDHGGLVHAHACGGFVEHVNQRDRGRSAWPLLAYVGRRATVLTPADPFCVVQTNALQNGHLLQRSIPCGYQPSKTTQNPCVCRDWITNRRFSRTLERLGNRLVN